jgi:hypothetical protein
MGAGAYVRLQAKDSPAQVRKRRALHTSNTFIQISWAMPNIPPRYAQLADKNLAGLPGTGWRATKLSAYKL